MRFRSLLLLLVTQFGLGGTPAGLGGEDGGSGNGPAAAGQNADIRLLQSDAGGIVVEFVPAYRAEVAETLGGVRYLHVRVDGALADDAAPEGSPELLVRAAVVRLPGTEGNTVEILNADYEDVPGVVLAPVKGLRKSEAGLLKIASSSGAGGPAYANGNFLPAELVSLAHAGETRGLFLADLLFHPYQYDPRDRALRKYRRIVARIAFGPASEAHGRPDDLTAGIALNDPRTPAALTGAAAAGGQAATAGLPAAAGRSGTFAPGGDARALAFRNSVLSSGPWYRFTVTEEGMYKLTGRMLLDAGIPASTDPRTIRIFGNGGREVPLSPTAPYVDDLLENAVLTADNGTAGALDPDDYILFYGKGTRGWAYDPAAKRYSHYLNHYTESNVYWLTYGGAVQAKAMAQIPSLNDPAAVAYASVAGRSFREDDKVNLLASGLDWLAPAMNSADQVLYVTPLPGLDATRPVLYRIHLGSHSPSDAVFTVREHSSVIATDLLRGTVIDDFLAPQLIDDLIEQSALPSFTDGQSQLRFLYTTGSLGGSGYIDWVEILYNRFAVAQNDVCSFSAPDTAGTGDFIVTGLSDLSAGNAFVFDVSKFDDVALITAPRRSRDTLEFQMALSPGRAPDIVVAGPSGFKVPGTLVPAANQNLHGDTAQADYIIVTHADFLPAAARLKAFREGRGGGEALATKVVDIDQIYNEFGGGLPSPAAVRNYLRYLTVNSAAAPPRYALLFGDGDYDYRRIIAGGPDRIPPWETPESFTEATSYATEDNFVVFGSGDRVNMGIGRLTPASPREADAMVDKIIEYETQPARDPWKVRVTLVADDALAGTTPTGVQNDYTIHLDHAEAVARDIPALFETRKIYLFDYPTVYTSGGRRKPDVNQALDDQINQGTLILNYSGHGNPRLWAHERIFVEESDFPLLHNKGKYFFLVAATCNFSAFDMIDEQSGGELLAAMPSAGAIAVFSATRAVEAGANQVINDTLFRQLFQVDANNRLRPQRLGDVLYRTKQTRTGNNDKKYFLLGDPALRIGFPPLYASVDSINNAPASQTARLRALSKATLAASVRDSAQQQIPGFSGQSQLTVYDADRQIRYIDPDAGQISYKTSGSVLFRGQQTITGGAIDASFIVPKDISYTNANGRASFYFWNGSADGVGYTTNLIVGGTDTTAPADVTGPDITLYLDNRSFRPGAIVSGSPTLVADLKDGSGINTSGAGVGHQIELWLDGQTGGKDVSAYYRSDQDTYAQGTVTYPLGAMAEGPHSLRLRAWDTYNNSSTRETVFDVISGAGLHLGNVYNFPNPFSAATTFTFEHDQVLPVDAEIRIYTVAGRLIQSLSVRNALTKFVQVPWDGRDREGDRLANGVYLYKIVASTQDRRFSSEALGKLNVVR